MGRSRRSGRAHQIKRLTRFLHTGAQYPPSKFDYESLLEVLDTLVPENPVEKPKPRIIKIDILPPGFKIIIKKRPEIITLE